MLYISLRYHFVCVCVYVCAYIHRYIWARTSDETCKKLTVPFAAYGNKTSNSAKITQTGGWGGGGRNVDNDNNKVKTLFPPLHSCGARRQEPGWLRAAASRTLIPQCGAGGGCPRKPGANRAQAESKLSAPPPAAHGPAPEGTR